MKKLRKKMRCPYKMGFNILLGKRPFFYVCQVGYGFCMNCQYYKGSTDNCWIACNHDET